MIACDEFSQYYAELLEGTYDCVDRIVLNAFYPLGQTGGGMRTWWRCLRGDDSTLDNAHLRDMAGSFSRRLHAFCVREAIPLIAAAPGERKHELAQPYLPNDPQFRGLFLVIKGNAPAPVWEVKRNAEGRISDLRHRKTWPFVRHFYFHLIDPEWGHVTIRMFLFLRGTSMEEVYQKLIDRSRAVLSLEQVKSIFGFSHRPHWRAKRGRERTEVYKAVQAQSYDLTVFKIKWGNLTLKIYDKGSRVLRIEVTVHNAKEFRCCRNLERVPALLERMREMLVRFLATVQAAHVSFLDKGLHPVPRKERRIY